MRQVKYILFACVWAFLSLGTVSSAQGEKIPFSVSLKQALQITEQTEEPGLARLKYMRFYNSSGKLPKASSSFGNVLANSVPNDAALISALGIYLYNMYISTAFYGVEAPAALTIDYLGVLDSLTRQDPRPNYRQADTFYKKHKTQIKTKVEQLFQQAHIHSYHASDSSTDAREEKFIRLLTTTRGNYHHIGYAWKGSTVLHTDRISEQQNYIKNSLARSLATGKNKVITYIHNAISLEDFDSKIAPKRNRIERLYRCVNDECLYCSYLFRKQFCKEVNENQTNFQFTRIYELSAYSDENFLQSSRGGSRFRLANGKQAPPWHYHTATLVILRNSGKYIPLVIDPFLAGADPMPLDKWLAFFAKDKTFFEAVPFRRSRKIEDAIETPTSRKGNNVVVDGKTYSPFPVYQ